MATLRRASPLSSIDRRASIVRAALPLLRAHGAAVTTAQLASAAGVAEGTLFRAFPDKRALIAAALETAFDPAPCAAELRAIDRRLALRGKLTAAVEILGRRIEAVWQLMSILGMSGPPPERKPPRGRRRGRATPADDGAIRAEIVAIFAAHKDELRCTPSHAMRVLRSLAFAGLHPRITDNQPFAPAEIVSILLDGISTRPKEPI